MKLRIKLLAKKAGGNPNYKAFRGHPLPPPPDYIDPATVDLEKFAELIVRECAELNFRELGLSGSSSFDVSRMIKQHFGVEE
jgi:hypothetical protein